MVDFILAHINWHFNHRMYGDELDSFYLQE
jgi:hypothetical protein